MSDTFCEDVFCGLLPHIMGALPITSSFSVYIRACKEKIDQMGLGPITRTDIYNVLVHKFIPDRFTGILEYGRIHANLDKKGMESLVSEVALACLEVVTTPISPVPEANDRCWQTWASSIVADMLRRAGREGTIVQGTCGRARSRDSARRLTRRNPIKNVL